MRAALTVVDDMTIFALDLHAAIESRRIDPAPRFSALLTFWLSIMAAVGLAARDTSPRQRTCSAWCNRSSVPSCCQW